jgi:hypothetical protein
MATKKAGPFERLRALCLAHPESEEVVSHGTPSFRVKKGKFYAYFTENHYGDGRTSALCKAGPGMQELLVATDPDRYFVPKYVGKAGWVGVVLGPRTDWTALTGMLADGWRLSAPKRLLKSLDGEASSSPTPKGAAKKTTAKKTTAKKTTAKKTTAKKRFGRNGP